MVSRICATRKCTRLSCHISSHITITDMSNKSCHTSNVSCHMSHDSCLTWNPQVLRRVSVAQTCTHLCGIYHGDMSHTIWVMSHTTMSHVSRRIHRSCGEWVWHRRVHFRVAHILETMSRTIWVMSHITISHATYRNESCLTWNPQGVRRVSVAYTCTHLCRTYSWDLSYNIWVVSHITMSHVSHALHRSCSESVLHSHMHLAGCSARDRRSPPLYKHRNCIGVFFSFSHCCSVLQCVAACCSICSVWMLCARPTLPNSLWAYKLHWSLIPLLPLLQCVAVCGCSAWDRLLPTFYKHRDCIGVIFPFSHCCGVLQRVAVFAVCGCSARDQLCPTLYEHKTRIGQHTVSYSTFSICSMLQCAVVCCSVLQCVTACCSVLHCVAVCCSVLQCS